MLSGTESQAGVPSGSGTDGGRTATRLVDVTSNRLCGMSMSKFCTILPKMSVRDEGATAGLGRIRTLLSRQRWFSVSRGVRCSRFCETRTWLPYL